MYDLVVLQLRAFGGSELIADIANQLEQIHGARHVIVSGNGAAGKALVTADLVDDAVDQAVETVKRRGLPPEDVALLRLESIGPGVAQRPLSSVVWADLLSQAGANARPLARYLVFMATAGVIAAFGVIYANTTLVVGAMAISPDVLPICAAATALVLRRWNLAARAFATLLIGLGCASLVGGVMTFALHKLQLGPTQLLPGQSEFLAGLSTVNISTPIVAFAAGVAGMLALETRASSAVGVAISVTTIPASAYLGVAAGVGDESKALGALAVLGVNIAMLLIGGSLTLIAQRALARREAQTGT
ncbi:MAG: DUF389 domain-containing protein [Solirubrobacterales bacterium]|nr:DUF389 domain-containing protein [Solirubrobacterales bacterium]